VDKSNLETHAEDEFNALGWLDGDDDMQKLMCEQILELLRVFGSHGHSGSSAPYAINLFTQLAKFNPIAPLTGADDEWGEDFDGKGTQQNKRDSEVFKKADGSAYWISGKIFRDPNGCSYTNLESIVPVVFPWTKQKPEIVEVEDS